MPVMLNVTEAIRSIKEEYPDDKEVTRAVDTILTTRSGEDDAALEAALRFLVGDGDPDKALPVGLDESIALHYVTEYHWGVGEWRPDGSEEPARAAVGVCEGPVTMRELLDRNRPE